MQGEEHVAAVIERQQLITRQTLSKQDNSGVVRSTGLQPLPFGTETPGRKCFDQKRNMLRQWVDSALSDEYGG